MTRIDSLAALAMVALLAVTSAGRAAEPPVKIGIPVGLSGANSVVAPSVVQAAQLAAAEINAKGGILGRMVELAVALTAVGPTARWPPTIRSYFSRK